MEVHYLFSKNKKIGSYLIRWATKHLTSKQWYQVPSHVAILVNNRWVHESTLESGVKVVSYKEWSKTNTEIYRIKSKQKFEYKDIKENYKKLKTKKYDWIGAAYLGIHIISNKLFKSKIPKINKWDDPNKYFCSEVIGSLLNLNLSMQVPAQIMKKTLTKNR